VQRLEDVNRRLPDACPEEVLVLAALADQANMQGPRDQGLQLSEQALVLAQTTGDAGAFSQAASSRS
jgi:hypothetical protein